MTLDSLNPFPSQPGVAPDSVAPTRVLAVGLDASTIHRWLGESVLIETAPDLLQAVGTLWEKQWDVVVAGMGDGIERDLRTWLGAMDRTEGRPLLVAVVKESSAMGAASRTMTIEEVEARHITEVLEQTGGRITEAARMLGVHRNTLARKIRALRSKSGEHGARHTGEKPIIAIT